jgi:Ca2+-binding RTX toxin-like protein
LGKRTLIATAALALWLIAPAAAQAAATITYEGNNLVLTADPGGTNTHLAIRNVGGTDYPAFAFPSGGAIYPPATATTPGCIEDGSGYVICDYLGGRIQFRGLDGSDSFFVGEEFNPDLGIDQSGGGGNDRLSDQIGSANRTIDGGPGNDRLEGVGGNDVLLGGDGNDELDGNIGNDELRGGAGDDSLLDDRIDHPGTDVVDGGPGFDKLEPKQNQANISVDGQANDGSSGENDNVVDVEYISWFGNGDGRFVMTQGRDKVEAFGTTGEIQGLGGDDELLAGDGRETIDGGAGDDQLTGGFNHDTITGGSGRDNIYADTTGSYCGFFTCRLPFGNDTVNASDGEVDNIDCGVGTDTATVDPGDVVANCETVNRVQGGPGGRARCRGKAATRVGTNGRDSIRGTRRRDVIAGLGGNDVVRGLGGNDLVCGGRGNDRLFGGGGKDTIYGEAGKDRIAGEAGADRLFGGSGADRLLGGGGADRLLGGAGRDRLVGGPGRDLQRQ